jgi:hypothetical protein
MPRNVALTAKHFAPNAFQINQRSLSGAGHKYDARGLDHAFDIACHCLSLADQTCHQTGNAIAAL